MAGEIGLEKTSFDKPETGAIKVESPLKPENKVESLPIGKEMTGEKVKPLEKVGEGATPLPVSPVNDWQKKRAAAIDDILAEGLNEVFLKMKPEEQVAFKKAGEETVTKINKLLLETKVKVNKVVELIRRWLKLIPGINRFFLEQEVKIKADKIMKIKNKF